MKYLLLVSIFFSGCKDEDGGFKRYVDQLQPLTIPIIFKTIEYPAGKVAKHYDKDLFERYKLRIAQAAYGKLYSDATGAGIIYTVAGDISTPVLVTYDKQGNKVDSFNLFQNASGVGLESEVYERVSFLSGKTIQVVDSTVNWKINKSGDDRIEGSEKLTIDSIGYTIDDSGRIHKRK